MIDLPIQESIIIFIAGPVASGKTFLTKQIVRKFERSLVLDVGANHLDSDYQHIWASPKQLARRLESNPYYYRIAYHPNSQHIMEELHWCYCAMWTLTEPRWFVVEEVHQFAAVNSVTPEMDDVLRMARHNILGLMMTSQRIADVDKLVTQNARLTILFFTQEFRDIEAVRLRWGPDAAEALTKLRPCIYNDVTEVCEQEPQCLLIERGKPFRIVDLGTKTKTEDTEWQEPQPQPQEKPEVQSLEPDSGNPAKRFPASTSEPSSQN